MSDESIYEKSKQRVEFEEMMSYAAYRGAQKALSEVGLADEKATEDIRTVRSLIRSIRIAQVTFWKTVVRWVTIGVLTAVLYETASRLNILK
jgi:hypothetical protein